MWSLEAKEDLGEMSGLGKSKCKMFKKGRALVCLGNSEMAGMTTTETQKRSVSGDEVGEEQGQSPGVPCT